MEDVIPTQEELAEEAELSKKLSKEEMKEQVIEKFGLDPVDHEVLIESLTEEQYKQYERTGKLIAQKRSLRDKLKTPPKEAPKTDSADVESKARAAARAELDEEYLDTQDVSDEIKASAKKLAQLEGISIRKAFSDPYIQAKKADYEKEKQIQEATISRTNKTAATTTFDINNPPKLDPNVDYNTPEGKIALTKYKAQKAKWLEQAEKQ